MLTKSRFILVVLMITAIFISGIITPDMASAMTKYSINLTKRDGAKMVFRDRGNSSGTPVIMLHGWPESSYCWEGVTKYLGTNLRVIAPDLRGLGDSARTTTVASYQKLELAKDVLALADALGISSFYLVGHDWGGGVAQEIAILAPSRVKKLVIINFPILTNAKGAAAVKEYMTSVGYRPYWYQYFQMQPTLPETMIKGNEDTWVKFFFGTKATDGTISSTVLNEYVRCYKISGTPASAANYYRSMSLDYQHWATLSGKFAMPGLYIYGNQDTVIIKANTQNLEDCFDSITVKELATGHFVMDEKPQDVANLLNDFLK